MRSRKAQAGIIIGALLTAMVIVALPRAAEASGWRCGSARRYHGAYSRYRFGRFHRGFHYRKFHRYGGYPQGFHRQKFYFTRPGYTVYQSNQGRGHYGYVRQGLGYGGSLSVYRR